VEQSAMVDIKDLLEYNKQVRQRYLQALTRIPWEELTRNREASFNSIRNIFIHTLKAIDYWLDVLLNEQNYKAKQYKKYKNLEEICEYKDYVEERMQSYLDNSFSGALSKKYVIRTDLGTEEEVTAEDILIHLFEEEVHHRGELIALLWQMNIEPPLMGWKYL
jgi:uncharacterized damage-inducible protein DinB